MIPKRIFPSALVLLALFTAAQAHAATRIVGTCPGATDTTFATAYNQLGAQNGPHVIRLCPGTHVTAPVSATWGHTGLIIESLSGTPADTRLESTGTTLMTTASQHFTIRGVSLVGNITVGSSGNAFRFENAIIEGSISAASAPLVFQNTTLIGNASSTGGSITLNGGEVTGNLLGHNGVTTTDTNVTGNVTATNGAISLSGGIIDGNIGTNGNSQPITLDGVTLPSGSIHTTGNTVTISGSTLGSANSPVPVQANNGITVNDSRIWGDLTALNWAQVFLNPTTEVYGTCTPAHTGGGYCGTAPESECSEYIGRATINEVHRSGNNTRFVELRLLDTAIPASEYRTWTVSLCSSRRNACLSIPLDAPTVDHSNLPWLLITKEALPHQNDIDFGSPPGSGMEIRLDDGDGRAIDYLSVNGYSEGLTADCAFPYDTTMSPTNAHTIMRLPDGTGAWTTQGPGNSGNATPGASNDGDPVVNAPVIRLQHDTAGVTCEATRVRVLACVDETCSQLFDEPVEVTLDSSAGEWSANPVSFNGGSVDVSLRHTTPDTVMIGAQAVAPMASTPARCFYSSGVETDCRITFDDFGMFLDGNADAPDSTNIPTQIAGKPSNVGFNATPQRVRLVRTDMETRACVPGTRSGTLLPIRFAYDLPEAATGLADNRMWVEGIGAGTTSATLEAAGEQQAVHLLFDASGNAPFHFAVEDAGRYTLHIEADIPVFDEHGEPTDTWLSREDTSNAFIVRPLAILIDAFDNPRAAHANDGVLRMAGADFLLRAQPIAWTPGADPDGNGQWGDCGDPPANPATTRVPTWNATLPGAQLYAPSGGVAGHLHVDDGTVDFSHAAAEGQKLASYTEVGIFTVRGTTHFPAPTSGTAVTVPVCSYRIGRFVPSHFTLSINTPLLENTCTSGAFTYSGQPFGFDQGSEPSATLSARNQSGQITRNYFGDYWKLAIDAPVLANRALSFDNAGDFEIIAPGQILWDGRQHSLGGEATFTLMNAEFRHLRPTTPVEPFTPRQHLRFNEYAFRDTDGTCLRPPEARACLPFEWTPPIEGTEIRWGRLSATTEHSPFEDQALSVPFTLEYFSAAGRFDTHTADTCSVLDTASVTLSGSLADIWSSAPPSLSPGVLPDGIWGLDLSAPGSPGFVDGIPDLGAAGLEWLRFDWSGSGAHDEDPRGRASWGIYRGNERVIRLREVW